jgi:hypothetical protein
VTVDLFAGLPVSDYQRVLAWYGRLLGSEPAFLPNVTEAVWELAEHRHLYIEDLPEHAVHGLHTVFVDDLDERVESIGAEEWSPPHGRPTRTVSARWSTATQTATKSALAAPRSSERYV